VCALSRSLGGYRVHGANDYAGGAIRPTLARLERGLREAQVMAAAFDLRCEQHGRKPSSRRLMIQAMALAEAHISLRLLRGRLSATKWLLSNDLRLPLIAKAQLLFSLCFPARLAVFIKNQIINRFVALD
jgi:hypothetical protein